MITHSNIQGGASGTGNVDSNLLFIDPNGINGILGTEDDDLHLLSDSPCIDADDSNTLPVDEFDLDGDGNTTEPIPFDLAVRIRQVDDLNTPDAHPAWPVVDIGAYEFQGYEGNTEAIAGVTWPDIANLSNYWLHTDCGYCGGADFTGDQAVTWGDLMAQAANWLCD